MLRVFHNEQPALRHLLHKGDNFTFEYPCASQTYCSPYHLNFPPGLYYLEVYGAQGCHANEGQNHGFGAYGGYAAGFYKIEKPNTKLYLHIGGRSEGFAESYNGGGGPDVIYHDGPGGGATDFRTRSGAWNMSLDSRIIVAGGGGGGFAFSSGSYNGGRGGGPKGEPGTNNGMNRSPVGTQQGSEGGIGTYNNGSFGKGYGGSHGGGGGGYYGGGCAYRSGGGGGSGYVGGVFSLGRFRTKNTFSNHTGSGKARITVIHLNPACTVKNNFLFSLPHIQIFFYIILS